MVAAEKGHTAVVKFLVSHGADPNMTDADGTSALTMACERANLEVISYLISSPVNAKLDLYVPPALYPPVLLAVHHFHDNVVDILWAAGSPTQLGVKPDHAFVAASKGHAHILKFLMEKKIV